MISSTLASEILVPYLEVDGKPEPYLLECLNKIATGNPSLIMLSGWIDSTTLLYLAQRLGNNPIWVEFQYEWKPSIESGIVDTLSWNRNVDVSRIHYPTVRDSSWNLSHFRESNSFYYAIVSAFAYSQRVKYILAGQILDDWQWSWSLEASPEFYHRMNQLLAVEYWAQAPEILAPFIHIKKKQVVALAKILDVPLADTRSCIAESKTPCWVCEQCQSREEALNS